MKPEPIEHEPVRITHQVYQDEDQDADHVVDGNGGQAPSFASLYEPCAAVPPNSMLSKSMIRFLPASIFMSIHCACAIEIRLPEGWSQVDVPSEAVPYKMPPLNQPMIRLLSPGKDGSATIGQMKVAMSLDEAAQSYARGMPMRGFTIESTAKVNQNGHEGRHIKGYLTLAGKPNRIPVAVYIMMTQECILSVEVVGTKAPTMVNDVLSWIIFKPVTDPPKE